MKLRDAQIHLRLSQKEKEMIQERMKFCRMDSISAYIRRMAIDGCIVVVDHSDIKRYNYELNRIGNNINQIAHVVNATGSIYREDVKKLQEMMDTIWQLQKSNQYIQL